jgi:hypothetical protein
MPHVVLLGDSIFDNEAYVPGGPPVIEQLRRRLPRDWRATLLAVDGAVCGSVAPQLRRLPEDASHLVVSVGGNDALQHSGVLEEVDRPAVEVFTALTEMQQTFRHDYRAMLRVVLAAGIPTAVCTVYDAVPGLVSEAVTLLSLFNDVIVREAAKERLPVLDLRLVCDEPRDYSTVSPIEPSAHGGQKIVQAIGYAVTGHDFGRRESVVYGKP